ncbi:MAG: metallopeptidase family protein [Propionibacteriaceae bacterium]|nr:metallopeptidase family protein [Propionibacteriaceae bacterium]
MSGNRDRHGRGVRGPLSTVNPLTRQAAPVPDQPSPEELFQQCVQDSIEHIGRTCPEALLGVDIGIETVPSRAAMWQEFVSHDAVPLAAAIDKDADHPARIALFRRPIERRAIDRVELAMLVHRTLVEQLSMLTNRSIRDIDPELDEDW